MTSTSMDDAQMSRRALLCRSGLGCAAGLFALTQTRGLAGGLEAVASPASQPFRQPGASVASGRAPGPASLVIDVVDRRKVPPEIRVAIGSTVAWSNHGAEWLRMAALDGSFDSGRIEPGDTFAHRFTRLGSFHYVCEHHAIAGTTGRIRAM